MHGPDPPHKPAESLIPSHPTLAALNAAASACRACDLWSRATQTVFGEGAEDARLMLVGEQPGDVEDARGRPFVGPAGRLLDAALEAAGIDRRLAYVTNAVKHFSWEPRGKGRLHKTPNAREIEACHPWLQAEIDVLRPQVLVCLGATGAKALLDPSVSVTRQRGRFIESPLAPHVTLTVHPSSVLRERDEALRRLAMERLVADLRVVLPYLD